MLADAESALIAAEAARRTAQFALIGTVITALIAIINVVITQRSTKKTQREVKELELQNSTEMAELNAALGKRKSEEDARRDYDYEARKRLYQECEPLIFQFVELSENALHRIYSLARSTSQGKLPDWLVKDEYYIASTMYHLLAPVVVYKLIQRRLTIVDLTLDNNIDKHYQLAKHLAWSFTADFDLAWGLKIFPLPYDPNHPDWKTFRTAAPATYWRQGLPIGRFDNAVEALIVRDPEPDGLQRVMSFGEFETGLHTPDSTVNQTFSFVRDMMTGFHPETRPTLWRMLITQAHIYDAIVRFHKTNTAGKKLVVVPIRKEDRKPFYWRRDPNDVEQQQLDEPFMVAEAYLQKWVGNLFRN